MLQSRGYLWYPVGEDENLGVGKFVSTLKDIQRLEGPGREEADLVQSVIEYG